MHQWFYRIVPFGSHYTDLTCSLSAPNQFSDFRNSGVVCGDGDRLFGLFASDCDTVEYVYKTILVLRVVATNQYFCHPSLDAAVRHQTTDPCPEPRLYAAG